MARYRSDGSQLSSLLGWPDGASGAARGNDKGEDPDDDSLPCVFSGTCLIFLLTDTADWSMLIKYRCCTFVVKSFCTHIIQ